MGCLPARAQRPLMQTRPTHVYIVDDSQPIRARLAHLLGSLPDVQVVGQAASANEAIAGILRVKPDSVLLCAAARKGAEPALTRKSRRRM